MESLDPKKILIYEPGVGGHRAEFIQYLLEQIVAEEDQIEWRYTFAVSEELCGENPELLELAGRSDAVRMVPVPASKSWADCRAVVERFNPTHLMLMELTTLELALCFRRLPCSVSAILFVQYPELRSGTWKQRVKFALKHVKTWLFLKNPQVHRIFLLNGEHSCAYLNKRFKTNRYLPIPDPVPPAEPAKDFCLRERYGLDDGLKLFLFFGSISARKGADMLFESLLRVSDQTREKSAFLVLGRPESNYAKQYAMHIERLRRLRPGLKLICDDCYFEPSEMKAAFQQADWILMPYVRPEYSSGILAHAANVAVPVIAPDTGLLGRLVKENELGKCSKIKPRALAESIDSACISRHAFDDDVRQAFVKRSNHFDFARIILNSVRHE